MRRSIFVLLLFVFGVSACASEKEPPEVSRIPARKAKKEVQDGERTDDGIPSSARPQLKVAGNDGGVRDGAMKSEGFDDAASVDLLMNARVGGVRPISERSLSVKVSFEEGGKAVFKPLRKGNHSARYEVAFSRLASYLEIDGAPRAVARAIPSARILGHLRKHFPEVADRFSKEVTVDDTGMVHGAMIQWMEDLGPSELDGKTGKARIRELFKGPGKTAGSAVVSGAAAVSDMIVLDYLTGNWDRFSGGNLFTDAGGSLILIDNNGSFSRWSDRQRERMEGYLLMVDRFSSDLIERIRNLDDETIKKVVRGKMGDEPILSGEEIELLLKRRDEILARVEQVRAGGGPVWF